MLEFRWKLPGGDSESVALRVDAWHGWLGRKVLTVGAATVFRRGWSEGIEARFFSESAGSTCELRMEQAPSTRAWRPVLYVDGVEVPEITGSVPPRIVPPPKSLAIPVGLTYLVMFVAVVMFPQASRILDAFYLRFDDRKLVMRVVDPHGSAEPLSVIPSELPIAVEGEPYAVTLGAVGGEPPYQWEAGTGSWPRGMDLLATGEVRYTPPNPRDRTVTIRVTDAAGATLECPLALVVHPRAATGSDWPMIMALSVPELTAGQACRIELAATGGQPPYTWSTLGKQGLPEGLSLDREGGVIEGEPEQAGGFPVTLRVVDSSYAASRDIIPWVAPFVVTGVCLLGFLGMRRWSACVYAFLILLQIALSFYPGLPVSVWALALQGLLWLLGVLHWGRMH